MASPQGHPARREPLLWIQLLGLAALPLETLLLLLLLAGADPGPLPGLERLLAWCLGALGPALLLWRRPADLWSLLLLQVPARGRRQEQQRLSGLPMPLALRLLMAAGAALLLPLLWWVDGSAALAHRFSPLLASPRVVCLLLSVPLLAVMLWQWQQCCQALWLLSRSAPVLEAAPVLESDQLEQQRFCLGLPLLLVGPLQASLRPEPVASASSVDVAVGASIDSTSVAIEPEQTPEAEEGGDLDQQIG